MRPACLPALLTLWTLLASPGARAEPYEVELAISDEGDLRALYEDGVLSEEDFATLLEVLRAGVDLRTASREGLYTLPGLTWAQVEAIVAYRTRSGGLGAPGELVEAGVLTAEQLRRLRPFLVDEERGARDISGRVRLLTAYAAADALVPPVLLQAQVDAPLGFRGGGVATLTRRRLGPVRYDSRRRALTAGLPGVAFALPKLHVMWAGAHASVLVGTYRLGFAQRLTLDTTGRPAPDGFVPDAAFLVPGGPERRCMLSGAGACSAEEAEGRVTPDFGGTEGFRGVVGTVHGGVEGLALSLTGFGSYQSRDISQYELLDAKTRKAPDVLAVLPGARVPGVSRFVSRTLPDVFHELTAGGHVTVGLSPRTRLGLTSWGSWPVWAVEGVALEFRESSRYPEGGGFGAVGVDAAWGAGPVDLFFEGARGFAAGQGGGFGAVQRTVLGDRARELELTLRYYGRDFANPYGRPVSSPDEFEGLRASNEVGARLRYLHRTAQEAWRLSGAVDVWTQPPGGEVPGLVQLRTSARVDYVEMSELQPSVWVEHRNKDLGRNGPGLCFEGTEGTSRGAPLPCGGEQYRLAGRVRLEATESLALAVQYQHTLTGSDRHPEGFQKDGSAVLDVLFRPLPTLRLHGRASWRDEDLSERTRLTQGLRTSLEVAWAALSELGARARYELALDLKSPEGARSPPEPPQHLFRLELEGRF
ncbi:helix-hairpin-helix domain-containing protein [Archangium sp.]|uniref:helix-hairpin-helix domain-containing protein n=1 Tax=Archangium sp. TaxID=1872627 RepID=UPI002ED7AB50